MSDPKTIVNSIEKSVLVIGPSIILDKKGKSLPAAFSEIYAKNNQGLIKYYFEHDNLIKPTNNYSIIEILKEYCNFYENEFSKEVSTLYNKISQIPFPLIISLNPDETLINCFKQNNRAFEFDYVSQSKKNVNDIEPTTDKPYLINLLGVTKDPESLVLTYSDLFKYLANTLHNGFPSQVDKFLQNAISITFFGVDFDKWYFQLLVQLLVNSSQKYVDLRLATPDLSYDDNVHCICKNNFEIRFVGPEVMSFINELNYHFRKKDEKIGNENTQSIDKDFQPEIFISYCSRGEGEIFKDSLVKKAQEANLPLTDYKDNMIYKGDKWKFMKRLGWGKCIIIILSEEYFQSENCMFELKEIILRDKDFEDRIFPVVISTNEFNIEDNWKAFSEFWKTETKEFKENLIELGADEIRDNINALKRKEEILKSIPIIQKFIDNTNYLVYKNGNSDIFSPLFKEITMKIQLDLRL